MKQDLFIKFECGRRDGGDYECRWCGRHIHQRLTPGAVGAWEGDWFDGTGQIRNDILGSGTFKVHDHEPAKVEGPELGPFTEGYVQLTYDSLRYESEIIAYFDRDRGDWIIEEPWTGAGEAYSDIVIYPAKEDT